MAGSSVFFMRAGFRTADVQGNVMAFSARTNIGDE
jgi:hypothetical protein